MRILAGVAVIAAFAFAGVALAQPGNVEVEDGALVTTDGMPLYTFARDTQGAGESACVDGCLARWPILEAADDAADDGDWTVITRDDGTKQWAYKGWPLYMFADDTAGEPATGVSANWPLAVE